MTMTNEEIVRDYNQAANKRKQIKILADLNCCSPSEIRQVLAQAGVAGVKMPERIVPRRDMLQKAAGAPEAKASADRATAPSRGRARLKPASGLDAPIAGSIPAPAFYDRVEAILAALPEDLSDDTISCVQNLLQTLFADYLHQRLYGEVAN